MTGEKHRTRSELFADAILGAALAFCLAVLAYATARKVGWVGGGWHAGILIYVGAASVGVVFFGISLRFRESRRVNLALVVLSTALTLYLAEIVLVLGGPGDSWLGRVVKHVGMTFDPRTQYEVVKDLRNQGIDAVPAILPHVLLFDDGFDPDASGVLPLAGISEKTTVLCNESGEYAIYVADEHGFNNPRGLYKIGAVDVALVGDSFVQGFCVPPGDDIAAQLRSSGLRALSLGMGNSGPLLELAFLTEYAVIYHPKIVLWFYYENDDIELLQEEQLPILRSYLTAGFNQNLRNRQPQINQVLTGFLTNAFNIVERKSQASSGVSSSLAKALGSLIKLYHLRTFLSERLHTPKTTPLLPMSRQFQQVLTAAKDRVRAAGGRFYFVYLPSLDTFTTSSARYRAHHDQVLSAVHALGIGTIDFLERIDSYSTDPVKLFAASRPAHYSAAGYRLLRDTILDNLVKDEAVTGLMSDKASDER